MSQKLLKKVPGLQIFGVMTAALGPFGVFLFYFSFFRVLFSGGAGFMQPLADDKWFQLPISQMIVTCKLCVDL